LSALRKLLTGAQDCRYELGTISLHVYLTLANRFQAYFAKFCFSLGINLRRIEVISDDEGEIVEAVRRMSKNYDFVVTSGGIGPT
jgi:molybdopterin biosynthesis enzyme MoaB